MSEGRFMQRAAWLAKLNEAFAANRYMDSNRVSVAVNPDGDVVCYVLNKKATIKTNRLTEYDIYCAITDKIREMYEAY